MDMATEPWIQEKSVIRTAVRAQRRAQDAGDRMERSRAITRTLLGREEYQKARTLLVYLSNKEEVATDELVARALAEGKRVWVPVMDRETRDLRISELPGPGVKFRYGPYGIREPETEFLKFVSVDQADLVILPGVAFDRQGGRIGYGKGYFDRLLNRLDPRVPRVALAFDFQVLDTVPQSGHDERVSLIITEKSIMDCSGIE